MKVKVAQSCPTLCDPMTEFSRPEYCSGYTFHSPGDLLNPGTEPITGGFYLSHTTYIKNQKSFLGIYTEELRSGSTYIINQISLLGIYPEELK